MDYFAIQHPKDKGTSLMLAVADILIRGLVFVGVRQQDLKRPRQQSSLREGMRGIALHERISLRGDQDHLLSIANQRHQPVPSLGHNQCWDPSMSKREGLVRNNTRVFIGTKDTGSTLVMELAYVLIVTTFVGGLSGWMVNYLKNTSRFTAGRSKQPAPVSAVEVAPQCLRNTRFPGIGLARTVPKPSNPSCRWMSPSSTFATGSSLTHLHLPEGVS